MWELKTHITDGSNDERLSSTLVAFTSLSAAMSVEFEVSRMQSKQTKASLKALRKRMPRRRCSNVVIARPLKNAVIERTRGRIYNVVFFSRRFHGPECVNGKFSALLH